MGDVKRHPGLITRLFGLAAAACLGSGVAHATCNIGAGSGAVACYLKVQPIDVCQTINGTQICAPFNTASQNGNPSAAGMPLQSLPSGFVPPISTPPITGIPNNSTSSNPIGFVVDPATGQFPGDGVSAQWPRTNPDGSLRPAVDITRTLLNTIGVELVWLPMNVWSSPLLPNYSTLQVNLTSTGTTVAKGCTGYISGTTLTITAACTTGALAANEFLSSTATGFVSGTFISAFGTASGGVGTYSVSPSQTVGSSRKPITINATSSTLASQDLLNLSDQANPPPPNTSACPVSQMTIPPTSPCGGPSPSPPLSSDPGTINLFFVNNLIPPAAGGTLYGYSNLCNNGVAIGGNTFFAPSPLDARPSTIAHELGHNLCLQHTTFGAGPWTPPPYTFAPPIPPTGVAPPFPAKPVVGECDSAYPACAANLMTAGNLRTEPTVACVLAGMNGTAVPNTCKDASGNQLPGLFNPNINLMADRVTPLPAPPFGTADATQLPISQDDEVLGSGLLSTNTPQLQFSGLLNPIPHETTKAQLGTGGSFADRAIFELSAPIGGRPGETLVAWGLTLPNGQNFAGRGGFRILSQSRPGLVQDVNYSASGKRTSLRNIAYQSGTDNNLDNPSNGAAGPSPCASATAACLTVRFKSPGLGAHDTVSFSESILNTSGAPITNRELCNAKITYMFSDGFTTTSNFGRCPPSSSTLIASSWHPDPHVAPYIVPNIVKSNVLLAALQSSGTSLATGLIGNAYLNNPCSQNATTDCLHSSNASPDVTFSVPPGNNPACSTGTLCFDNRAFDNIDDTLAGLLTPGGATILSGAAAAGASTSLANTVLEFTGLVTVTTGQQFTITQDDGVQLKIGNTTVFNSPGPTSPMSATVTYNGPSGTFPFDLVYGECCGPPAVLDVSLRLYPTLPCTPIQGSDPPACMDTTTTPPADADASMDGGQRGQTCDNGVTYNNPNVTGTIVGPVGGLKISAGQTCNYSNCTIVGNLTINGGQVNLNCTLNGNLTVNSGFITLGELAQVLGNVQISQSAGSNVQISQGAASIGANGFRIGNSTARAYIRGNLTIQNLEATQTSATPPTLVPTGGLVCNTQIGGSVTVQYNTSQSAIEIGDPAVDPTCLGNIIGGQLLCSSNNPPVTSGGNMVQGSKNTCG